MNITSIILPRDMSYVPNDTVDRAVKSVVICGREPEDCKARSVKFFSCGGSGWDIE